VSELNALHHCPASVTASSPILSDDLETAPDDRLGEPARFSVPGDVEPVGGAPTYVV
jgi:hypothetical protein